MITWRTWKPRLKHRTRAYITQEIRFKNIEKNESMNHYLNRKNNYITLNILGIYSVTIQYRKFPKKYYRTAPEHKHIIKIPFKS